MSKYGEPWKTLHWDEMSTRNGTNIRCGHEDEIVERRDRAIACVNACEGISDPAAAIQAAREAMETMIDEFSNYAGPEEEPRNASARARNESVRAYEALRHALSLLTPKGTE